MKCIDGCTCEAIDICEAKGLKQCLYCKDVMKSQYSTAQCRTASGIKGKPLMIVCGQSTKLKAKRAKKVPKETLSKKTKYEEIYGDFSAESSSSSSSEADQSAEELEDQSNLRSQLFDFWESVSPPVDESTIKGKWFAAIYKDGVKSSLYIGRALQRFLKDKDGDVSHLELDCLKPRIGNVDILDGYPPGQDDKYLYPLEDVLGGPLDVIPVPRKRSWKVKDLKNIESFYERVKNEDRKEWIEKFRQGND